MPASNRLKGDIESTNALKLSAENLQGQNAAGQNLTRDLNQPLAVPQLNVLTNHSSFLRSRA